MDETGDIPAVEMHEPVEPHCHNCGAPHDRFQEYCLECGARLQPLPQFGRGGPGSPYWFWASLIALLVLALITAAVVIAATDDDQGAAGSSSSSTLPATVAPTGLTTIPITDTTVPTFPTQPTVPTLSTGTTGTTGTTSTGQTNQTPPPPPPPASTTNPSGLTEWPDGKSGWTAILESVPASQGKAAAEQKAQTAKGKGLQQVGVLNSGEFEGLNPGYWVVFSGVGDTEQQGENFVQSAKGAGYSTAYLRQITPK